MYRNTQTTYVTYEDRPTEYVGVALLVLTLVEHNRNCRLHVFGKNVPTWFQQFVGDYPAITLRDASEIQTSGWTVKPEVLLHLLNGKVDHVVWLDADMAVTASLQPLFEPLRAGCFVVAEQPKWAKLNANACRAEAWGLECVREFSPPINSCVVGASVEHIPLLRKWRSLMRAPE